MAGGDAFHAAAVSGLALGNLQADQVQVAGVAPMIPRMAERGEVVTISGLRVVGARRPYVLVTEICTVMHGARRHGRLKSPAWRRALRGDAGQHRQPTRDAGPMIAPLDDRPTG
jgi:hypothetical protein